MNTGRNVQLLLILLYAGLLCSCGRAQSSVPFSDETGHGRRLYALNDNAVKGVLTGPASTAWFSYVLKKDDHPKAIEVTVSSESGEPVQLALALVTPNDLNAAGQLVDKPADRILSVVDNAAGITRIRMMLPPSAVVGFAVRLTGSDTSLVRITGVSMVNAETGWQKTADGFWAGFGTDGGVINAIKNDSITVLPADSTMTLFFTGSMAATGTIAEQGRSALSVSSNHVGFRNAPIPYHTEIPSLLFPGASSLVSPENGGGTLSGMRVAIGKKIPAVDSANPSSPLSADPLLIIEWPQEAWRTKAREIFSWDRFPSVLIFDTADYAVQDSYFKRLAFFVEKQGYKGKLWTDAELSQQHAFNAHDYRAESLASFFELARKEGFELNEAENELRGILLAEGIIRKDGSAYAPGAGAVLSFSRQSAAYLRYMFMAHEGYHGIYFVDPDFRAKVAEVYQSMDARAVDFLETYFTVVGSLGYDTTDRYLMENEFMGYLMQQPVDKVAPYFTGTISERYLRYGGEPALARYIADTDAAEFVRAARELNDYVFSRWGICGGRNGLYYSD